MPVRYRLKRSRFLLILTIALHFLSLLVVALVKMPLAILLLMWLLILLSMAYRIKLSSGAKRCAYELVYAQDMITLHFDSASYFAGEVMASTVVTPVLILLHIKFSSAPRMQRLLICRDQLATEEYRQLSVLLRLS